MSKANPCDGCIYLGYLYGDLNCCNYIFAVGKPRPCPGGEGCTAKETVKRYRPRKSKMPDSERRARDAARKREHRAKLKAQREQMKEEA